MASGGGNDDERLPQFNSTDYEIPSWQIEWNKPWYQQYQGKGNSQSKYNRRGHDIKCRCAQCEDDLESAFTPESNEKLASYLFTSSLERKQTDAKVFSVTEQSPPSQKPDRVILFSDLPEVTQAQGTNSTNTVSNSTNGGFLNGFTPDTSNSNNSTSVGIDTDAMFNSIGALTSLQSVSDRVRDIQTRVHQFSGGKDSREFIVLRGLLVTSLAEINRINAVGIDWLQQAKNVAAEAISNMLIQLQDKIGPDDEY